MLTAHHFSELGTSVICHALPILCLMLISTCTSCKICFKAQSIGSKGTKIKVLCENNVYFDSYLLFLSLNCDSGTRYLI